MEAPPGRGPVPALGTHMAGDPLARSEDPGLGGGPGHVGQAAFPAVVVGDVVLGAVAALSSALANSSAFSLHAMPLWSPTHILSVLVLGIFR